MRGARELFVRQGCSVRRGSGDTMLQKIRV